MNELSQFCELYLPEYFQKKFSKQKRTQFFDYRESQNIFELTGRIVSFLDKLMKANPSFVASRLIKKHFVIQINQIRLKIRDQSVSQIDDTKEQILRALKKMSRTIRQAFQIFIRIVYIYFHCKQQSLTINLEKEKDGISYIQGIPFYYKDLKLRTLMDQGVFNCVQFMIYVLSLLIDLQPNVKFIQFVTQLIIDCDFNQFHKDKIHAKINKNQKIIELKRIQELKKLKMTLLPEMSSSKSIKSYRSQVQNQLSNSNKTPKKQKAQIKQDLPTQQSNFQQKSCQMSKTQSQSLKTLNIFKKLPIAIKSRSIPLGKSYRAPKNIKSIDQVSSTCSNNNQQEIAILDFRRTNSTRYLPDQFIDQDIDCLAGATPKNKKKQKIDRTSWGSNLFASLL